MNRADGFTIAGRDDLERTGNWLLVRRSLGLEAFGLNLVDIPPGESIPEHDELDRDQEEVFVVLAGDAVLVIDGTGVSGARPHLRPAGPGAPAHCAQRGRRDGDGADRVGAADERLRADGGA